MSNLKLKLTKIDPVKYAIITGALMALLSFIMLGIFMLFGALFGAIGASAAGSFSPFAAVMGGGIVALIFGPIIYFIFGFIFGLIGTMLFNFVLRKTGGLIVDFEKIGETESISKIGESNF